MKFVSLVPLAAFSSAIVIPDEATLNELAAQTESHNSLALPEHPLDDLRDSVDDLIEDARDDFESVEFGLRDSYHDAKNALDDAFGRITDAEDAIFDKIHETGFDVDSWLQSGSSRGRKHPRPFDHEGPRGPCPHGKRPPPPPFMDDFPPPPPPMDDDFPPPPPSKDDFPPPPPFRHHRDGEHPPPPAFHRSHDGEHPPPPPPFHRNHDGEHPPPPPPFHRNRDGEHPPPPPPRHGSQDEPPHDRPPHNKPPHDGPPHHGPPRDGPHDKPPHKGKPHHPPHHQKPNQTVYELISKSKYTTKLAKLINDDPELVKVLNGTAANYTVFAPTDKAFEKIPKHGKEPSEEFIKKLLLYHVSPDFYPAGRVLKTHTIPTLYKEPALGEDFAQRLSVNVGLRGLTLDFYSRIIAINIFGTNGVIHGIDTILIPPPKAVDIISLLPGEFSTLTLGLDKTGLLDALNTTNRAGGTFFAPSNWAFKKLGPRINAFLFSSYGEKYLTALLKYHVVPEQTLYSDAFYRPSKDDEERSSSFHVDLATLLDDKALSIDVGSFGPFTQIKINGFTTVAVQNGIAKDGVIQIVSNVLIPPKTAEAQDFWRGEPMSVEEFKERLAPFVESDDTEADDTELGWGEL